MIHVETGHVDNWLKEHLICPRDHSDLTLKGNTLTCQKNHTFPFIQGIPVMLLEEVNPTHMTCVWSLEQAADDSQCQEVSVQDGIDPFVQEIVASTCGLLYRPLVNNLKEYPIPELPLIEPVTSEKYLLDIGCNWGRWCISAARKGYYPIGIDPSINGIMAASRVSNQLGIKASYIVGDSRYLPFSFKCFDVVFSFGVLHHFEKPIVYV
jgi:2-polyprenyl-3-methyl-5-hydroxy-6-metoxy-1,4-benzoquinol methylase